MEAEERPAKIRKIEGTANLESSNMNDGGDIQEPSVRTGYERQDWLESQLDDILEHEENKADSNTEPALSKNAMKKLRRQQEWDAGRDLRKIKRKEKLLAKREKRKLERTGPEAPKADDKIVNDTIKSKTQGPLSVPLTFLLDCGFDELMLDKEIKSISNQITRCYSENRKAPYQPSLAISSFGGALKTRFDTVLLQSQIRWRSVQIEEDDFVAVAEKAKQRMQKERFPSLNECPALETDVTVSPESGEVVYLTADSDETLEELRPYSVYIIGGIVDKNRHKGICFKRAMDRGIKTAKLPIGKYMQMSSRAVLATNHVYEIMLKWLESKDWGKAFTEVIPRRKGGVLKGQDMQVSNNEDQEVENAASEDSDDSREAVVGTSATTNL